MVAQLKTVLHEDYFGETVILYQLFDNSCYMSCDEEGNRALPIKGRDHKYHVPGRLVLAGREEFRTIFTTVLPLLRAGLDNTKVLLIPLMRYIVDKCCDSETHITNKASGSYGKMMGNALAEMGEWLKDLAFTRRIRNFVVLCPNELLGEEESIKAGSRKVTSFWKESPVHMSQDGYTALADCILEKLAATTLSRKVDEDKLVVSYAGKEKLVDRTAHRPKWVTGNDSAVNRNTLTVPSRNLSGASIGKGPTSCFIVCHCT
jgi:hypothetical protein